MTADTHVVKGVNGLEGLNGPDLGKRVGAVEVRSFKEGLYLGKFDEIGMCIVQYQRENVSLALLPSVGSMDWAPLV
ncbi:hypothetical protein N7468_008532 [Penicillium chermesinum]|uniref:Uncharacterized protein n=1 Tax=Penicillium chermesinum TaxID=63820 RepID=A0A9W9NPW6_9EURO|nr:uncharacterized protein N7468_008532 [Penicillium chermesinum]KAJ5223990.1 hypothetical protein N7468_008532 [Penicillium chermesinum]